MSSSVFKVYEEDRDRNLVLPQEIGGGLDDSSMTEDGTCPAEATSTSGSSSGVVDERLKIDSNLVIVVGKDGSVHVDQKTLHSLLANETTDTSVSVVRIASPTPSIEDEIEQERRQKLEDQQLAQELEAAGLVPDDTLDGAAGSEDPTADSSSVGTSTAKSDSAPAAGPSGVSTRRSRAATTTAARKEDVLLDGGDPPHVSLMVEGFYPPEEARKFATEVLTLAGLRKPLTIETEPADYEFQRYVIANDHCYTPLTSPSQKLPPRSFEEQVEEAATAAATVPAQQQQVVEEGPSGRRRVPAAVSKSVTPAKVSRPRKKSVEESSSNDAEDLQSILEGSDSDSDYTEESSYPEEDDNLSDLDFDISGKSQSKKRKSGSSKNKSGSKKKEEAGQAEAGKRKSSGAVVKSPTKKSEAKLVTPVSMVTKSAVPKTYGSKKTIEVVPPPVQPVVTPPPPVPQVKKVKQVPKPAPHVEALFSDMTSLFSTPDIIKKVGQSKAVTPTTPTPSGSGRGGFVQLSKSTSQKLPAQISIQTHASASEESLIDVLAHDPDAVRSTNSTTPTPLTEDIVKMLEHNLPPGVGGTGGVQEPVLPITDNSILAALGSNDDGLPEDLLQHVAELAEHKELQEILDKQVLGVIGTDVSPMPLASTSAAIPIVPQQMMQPVIAPPQPVLQRTPHQPPAQKPTESLPTMTVKEQLMPRKEAIQIRRSDGRIITLPPIEAPATRSKRRAQTGTSGTPVASSPAAAPVAASPSTPIQSVSVVPSTINTPQSSKTSASSKAVSKSSSATVGITSYDDGSGSLMIDETPRGKAASGGSRSAASSRRASESSNNSGRGKRQSTAAVAAVVAAEAAEDEVESDESWNSEDDPDRLWCICRQPHNNRFMICCDVCEDWFHGKCVNITKAMGQQMEADGIEWTCPNCLKKKQEKQQPKMTDFLVSSSSSNTSITSVGAAITMSPKTVATITAATSASAVSSKQTAATSCVVCGKSARANSVYCSDSCIRKHAHGVANDSATPTAQPSRPAVPAAAAAATKQQTIVDGIKKMDASGTKAAATGKSGPIIVMERKTGRCLTGKNAPTAENLKAWLQSHPTFEVVPPGSPQAAIILAKQAEVRKLQQAKESQKKATSSPAAAQQQQTPKAQSQKHSDSKKNALFAPSIPQKVTPQSSKAPPSKTPTKTTTVSTPTTAPKSSSSSGSLSGAKTSSTATATTTSSASKSQKRPASAMDVKSSTPAATKSTPPAPAGENIRVTVKKTLKEHLLQRTSELDDEKATRLTEPEIDAFVAEVEEEMFVLFNKDTGTKYRAKYRSLVFNIKDRKNLSLFQKICEKRIEARQLVRMTPEELASQELAQWRENENKHQLEMIKKSELDLLACAKNYVLKTHKGEEVIEGKIVDRVELDPTTAVEDVVAVLNNSTVSSTSELDNSGSKDASFRSKDFDASFGKYSTGLYGSGSITSSTLTATATTSSSSSASKKKDSRRSRSRSRSRRRDRSRDRSRSKHKRKRSRSRSKSRDRARSRHRDHRRQDSKPDEKPATTSAEKDRSEAVGKLVEAKKTKKGTETSKPQVPESGNLIDQILASAGAAIGKPAGDSTEMDSTPVTAAPEELSKKQTPTATVTTSPSQDQEPTSTVTIPTPPHSTEFDAESPKTDFTSPGAASPEEDTRSGEALKIHWTGNVHMVDVASVEMSIRSVSGNIEDVASDFSEDLDICGTIKPEIVWDYIGQIKKSANKEICLVRFHSNEQAAYYTLYTHLFSRKRYSVIKSPSKAIKDFYVFPLPSEQMIPMILKPLNGVGIVEGDKKPDLLLGIIVKVCGTKRSLPLVSVGSAPVVKNQRRTSKPSGSAAVSPSFALMQQVITKYATKKPDLDASTPPGSPGGPTVPPPPSSTSLPKPPPPPPAPPVIQIRSRSASESPEQVDIDMDIIKRPALIAAGKSGGGSSLPLVPPEVSPPPVVIDDDDEPYSPGGASDDSDQFADVTAIVETRAGRRASSAGALDPDSERFRLEMEEINRKIAEEKNEIVGIISSGELKADEIKSTLTPSLITDISIPSNLSEILASINKSVPGVPLDAPKAADKNVSVASADDEEEYVPTAPSLYSAYKSGGYSYGKSATATATAAPIPVLVSNPPPEAAASTSKLSKLSDAELLSMVPDDSYLQPVAAATAPTSKSRPVDDVVELDSDDSDPPLPKKSKFDSAGGSSEPPPPGLEDEIDLA